MRTSHTYAVLGGGFAGVQAARRILRSDPGANVDIYDHAGAATMVPGLPDLASGRLRPPLLSRPLSEMFGDRASIRRQRVTGLDTNDRIVRTEDSEQSYDAVVTALGSVPIAIPPALESGELYGLFDRPSGIAFRSALDQELSQSHTTTLLVIGAGYTGLETASLFRRAVPDPVKARIVVVDMANSILGMLSSPERERVRAYLDDRSIELKLGTSVSSAERRTFRLSDGEVLTDAVALWSPGMRAAPIRLIPEPQRTRDGRVEVDSSLQLAGSPGVFAAGDFAAVRVQGDVARRAVNIAYYSGRRAGDNAVRHVRGRAPRAFQSVDLGWILPLGQTSSGKILGGLRVRGRLGLRLHYIMCGLRHFGPSQRRELFATAARLKRNPAPLGPSR